MPSDFLTEYRERLRDFHAELTRDAYRFQTGQQTTREARHLRAEYSDLWTATARTELQQALDATAPHREKERAGLQRLRAFATHEYLRASVRDLTAEIRVVETSQPVRWEGNALSLAESAVLLRQEPDAKQRHELATRCSEARQTVADLRAERLQKLHENAKDCGAENYLALYQKLRGVAYETLATQAQTLLRQTESQFVAAFAPALAREADITLNTATQADLPYFTRLARFDAQFPAWQLPHAARETFAGLGILTYKQENLTVEEAQRPHVQTALFPIRVPDEIKIVHLPDAGVEQFSLFLQTCGHAQHYAWMSRQLPPEFHFHGDAAVGQSFGLLFGQLPHDARWLAELLNLYESQELRHLLAVQKLLHLRQCAAQLRYEVELHTGHFSGPAAARYSELLTEAVRVRVDDTEHLRTVSNGVAVADTLRAYALEAQLREYLKTKFGTRWWAARKAGDFLIDLWNTGGRYQAEELAKLNDLGDLSFDWLGEECLASLQQ